jgi:phosphoglucomutase
MDYRKEYAQWRQWAKDEAVRMELTSIENDDEAIKSRFATEMSFGTAGLRSRLGAGPGRMNVYTVGRATQGLAAYVKAHGGQNAGMVIAYDTRQNSDVFARETALCFAANGVKAYLFEQATSVPELSFSILHLKAFGGVAITASHNPKDYNGYKAFASWGGQLLGDASEEVMRLIDGLSYQDVKTMGWDEAVKSGMLTVAGKEIDEAYYGRLLGMARHPENIQKYAGQIKAVYTPLFGTGMRTIAATAMTLPYDIHLVESQRKPDPAFPGLEAPNPEDVRAMAEAIRLAKEIGADIAFGTDPDADRMGAAVPNDAGEFVMLTGNQVGCILTDYLLRHRAETGQIQPTDFIVKSFVSTRMADAIARHFGIECKTIPTGFKYISDAIHQNPDSQFVFGFEESCGFLADTFVREKDGSIAALLLLEVLCECKKSGRTLYQHLRLLYGTYGWHKEKVIAAVYEGLDGMKKMNGIMAALRANPPAMLGGQHVVERIDYATGTIMDATGQRPYNFPLTDALGFFLPSGWLIIRPSGTEPKVRVYCGVHDRTGEAAEKLLGALAAEAGRMLS